MRKIITCLAITTVFLLAGASAAHTPKGGLCDVAVSPYGRWLVAGGDSRVLYVLDPATLQVLERIWMQTNIHEMTFNRDGTVLVVEDVTETLHFISSANWVINKQIENAGNFSASRGADLLAGFEPGQNQSVVKLFSMTDAQAKGEIEVPALVLAVALNPAGNRLAVLSLAEGGLEEEKATPRELRGLEREDFRQKHDGKVSRLDLYELPSLKKISENVLFYCPHNPRAMLLNQRGCLVLAYDNVNAQVLGGQVRLFMGENGNNYAACTSPDGLDLVSGGLRKGTFYDPASLTTKPFTINTLPGWPEYFLGFDFSPQGLAYGVTSAYRLVIIRPDGNILQVVPVF
jgi:hypothetical protein